MTKLEISAHDHAMIAVNPAIQMGAIIEDTPGKKWTIYMLATSASGHRERIYAQIAKVGSIYTVIATSYPRR